ncbi:MAG TPA: STAS domain-containing protein [Frankiaceae bacterium]|jgi:anti-sigma B factor antagonist|nr:STAS domain-containing protein [Frankiaceae bacterium]
MTVGASDVLPRYAKVPVEYETEAKPAHLRCSKIVAAAPTGQPPTVLLEVRGDLDKVLVARMRESLFSAAAQSPHRIVIDMAEVSFVDTVGLRTLIAVRRRCAAGGTGFALRRPSRAVKRLLSVTHLDHVFDVEHERRG